MEGRNLRTLENFTVIEENMIVDLFIFGDLREIVERRDCEIDFSYF